MGARSKEAASPAEAIATIGDGARLAVGGFGLCGIPQACIEALRDKGVKGLRIVSNNCGVDDYGLGLLLEAAQIDHITASYVGENKRFAEQVLAGTIAVDLVPQGTLAERLRAGGSGIPAFYTPTGVGSPYAEGKEHRTLAGQTCVLEEAIFADFALIKAWRADTLGNLCFRGTSRNFNPLCAMAGKHTIAEVEEIVEAGSLPPDAIHLPGIFVDTLVRANAEKRIERLKTQEGAP